MHMTETTNKSNRRPFFVVLGLFFAPLLVAFVVYYGSGWRPSGTTNKGQLISPAVSLPEVTLNMTDGKPTNADFLRSAWTMLYVGDGICNNTCRTALATTRVARQLLGKDLTRTKRVFLYSGECCTQSLRDAEQDLTSAKVDVADGQKLLAQFPLIDGQSALQGERIYLVDPLGNLMMSYAATVDARDIYKDMKKLLELSHIG
jgi:hypothetical protein